MSYLLDTNVVSELTRPQPEPRVVTWLEGVDEDRLFISVVTLAEIDFGIALLANGKKRDRLEAWLATDLLTRFDGRVLDVTQAIAREWGLVTAQMHRRGTPMDPMDGFLAVTARVHGLTLVTRNDGDFASTGVELFNPWNEDRPV